ncbi:MAG: CapA family protein, partial [bacterium]
CDPELREPSVSSAERYVALAEKNSGSIPYPVKYSYPWGFTLDELNHRTPDFSLVNLETSVTTSDDFQSHKQIHYRMHPAGTEFLHVGGIDVCCLANNHSLDFGETGLLETISSLNREEIHPVGAGTNPSDAAAPATLRPKAGQRVIVFATATSSSGVPRHWSANESRPGINRLDSPGEKKAHELAEKIEGYRKPSDLVILSIHWGGNWGFDIPDNQQTFAKTLIDSGTVDLIHGHSSHHVKGIHVHDGKLILYGCGDFLTDYEGISGHEEYRSDLGFMYFPELRSDSGRLKRLSLVPTKISKFQLQRPNDEEINWLRKTLNREGEPFGTTVTHTNQEELTVEW